MTNSAGPDQLAFSEANSSGSSLFAMAGYISRTRVKGMYGKELLYLNLLISLWKHLSCNMSTVDKI